MHVLSPSPTKQKAFQHAHRRTLGASSAAVSWHLPYPDMTPFCATSTVRSPSVRVQGAPGRRALAERMEKPKRPSVLEQHTPRDLTAAQPSRADGPPKHRLYHRSYPSDHRLRMPDLVKRLFAPPNCFFPAIDSPGRDTRQVSRQTLATPSEPVMSIAQERLIDTAVRKTLPRPTPNNRRPVRTRRDTPGTYRALPWISTDSLGFVPRRPRTPVGEAQGEERWSGFEQWQARTPLPMMARGGYTTPSCTTLGDSRTLPPPAPLFGRSVSLYSSIPSACCLSFLEGCGCHGSSDCLTPAWPTESLDAQLKWATMKEELVNQDIEAFLQGRWRPDPASAS